MIKALLLLIEPQRTWERIAASRWGVGAILLFYLFPLLALTGAIEGYGLMRWGEWQKDGIFLKKFALPEVVVFQVGQALLTLIIAFVGAKLIKALGETFHGRHTFSQTFKVVAYGLGPMLTMRIFDAPSVINPWIPWLVGSVLVMTVLYQGVPQVMQPDPPHAFGLYFMSSLLLVIITGLARFVAIWYLQGRLPPLENLIQNLATRLMP